MIHSNVQKVKFFSTPTKTDETMKKFWYGGCRTCRTRCVLPGSKWTFQKILNIFFLLKNHYSICDFGFLFGHHNSIYDTGLNISRRCLKAFLTSLNMIPKIMFPLYYIITVYSTKYYRWPEVDVWYLEECFAITVMWTISR